ncbi:MAG: TolC family protein [Nitrospirae bacterium]|nr:TolC family protein [Nitrospirota bacterium]
MKKVLFLICCFAALSVSSELFAGEYSLEDLYRLALENSKAIKISEENLYISKLDKSRAMAVLMPTVTAFGSRTEYTDDHPDNSTSWGVKIDQSLSMSGRELTALKIARESIVKSDLDLNSAKESYLLSVAFYYFDVLRARKSLDIANANVERLTKHRDAARTRLRVGESTKTVLLRAEAELSGAQSELIRAENGVKLARAVLARTVGIDGDYDVREPEASIREIPMPYCMTPVEANQVQPIDCLKQTALRERHELKSVELDRQIAERQVKYTKGSYWPTISVEGAYTRREEHPSTSLDSDKSVYGLIRIDYPFFEGGLRKAEVSQSEARFRQAEYRYNDLKDSVNVEVESAYLNMKTSAGVLEKLRAEADYARDNFNAVTKQFEYGLANSLDVMDANNLLVTSERQLANAQYDYELAILQLQRATGTLLKTVNSKQ